MKKKKNEILIEMLYEKVKEAVNLMDRGIQVVSDKINENKKEMDQLALKTKVRHRDLVHQTSKTILEVQALATRMENIEEGFQGFLDGLEDSLLAERATIDIDSAHRALRDILELVAPDDCATVSYLGAAVDIERRKIREIATKGLIVNGEGTLGGGFDG